MDGNARYGCADDVRLLSGIKVRYPCFVYTSESALDNGGGAIVWLGRRIPSGRRPGAA